MPTLNDILLAINAIEPWGITVGALVWPAPTAGTTTSLTDSLRLADSGRGTIYSRAWLTFADRIGSNRHRKIVTDTPSSGVVTWTAPLPTLQPVTTDDSYLIWTLLRPSQVEAAINRSLERMSVVDITDIAGVDSQTTYPLATDFPWITSNDDILSVSLKGTGTNRDMPLQPDQWNVISNGGVFYLKLLGRSFNATDILTIESMKPYASPLTNTGYLGVGANTTTAPLRWIAAETLLELLKSMTLGEWGPDAGMLERRRNEAAVEADAWRNKMRPKRTSYIWDDSAPPWLNSISNNDGS